MTTLKEFGFNKICDIQEELGARYRNLKYLADKKAKDRIIKIHKLWEWGFPQWEKKTNH